MPTLNWIGKEKVVSHHQDVPYKILEHKYGFDANGQTKNEINSGNKIIHGDNLEALKALLPEYEGKIDIIYIDPPYNTGNEKWVYNDNVNHPKVKKWLGEVVGKDGEDLTRHDKWLCMMYPRMKLLHRLLSDDGVIFISIDDNEQSHLTLLCDQIFGRTNSIGPIIQNKMNSKNDTVNIQKNHEFILVYRKTKQIKKDSKVSPTIINTVYKTKTLVIATGVSRKSLGIKGENEFKGRGVSYCSVCDGPFFFGKKVAVIGSGHEAIHDVEILSKTAKKVYAIPNGKGYNENYSELKILKNDPKIEFLHDTYVKEIKGTDFVESIKLEGNEPNEIKVDGVFLITEHIPVTKILSSAGIETDAGGCIIVDKDQKTNIPGVFAAGDCCCKGFQIVTATGMGACAALNAMKYIKQLI